MAKSTEIMMRKKTDWDTFAAATGAELSQLETGVVQVSKTYYEWADSLTPGDSRCLLRAGRCGELLLHRLPSAGAGAAGNSGRPVGHGRGRYSGRSGSGGIRYISDEAFETWYKEFTQRLSEAAAQ